MGQKSSMGCARSTRSADTYAPEVAEVSVSARLTGSSRGSRGAKATAATAATVATAAAGSGQGSKANEEEATERRRGEPRKLVFGRCQYFCTGFSGVRMPLYSDWV